MSMARRTLRQTLTIARRDFIATVATPAFLLFLLAPLIMMGFGAIGGMGAATMAGSSADKRRIVAIVDPAQAGAIRAADARLRKLLPPPPDGPPRLQIETPATDPATQAHGLIDQTKVEISSVLYGPLDRPHILYRGGPRSGDYLAALAEQALRDQRAGGSQPLSHATREEIKRAQVTATGKNQVAFFATFGLFFLTLLLSGQAVGTMAEERGNKVIEVLAAAVPLESVFLGKLIGMFGVALLFVIFWGTVIGNLINLLPPPMARGFASMGPAVGMPAFALLFFAYFTMAYLLLGAVFLGIGAQASNQREIQMLSLPITIFQVGMFGFASAAASNPGTPLALAAEVFPFSSPFAMAALAAHESALWPHLLALAWQALWVALTVTIGARWFRRGVLQSGSPKLRLFARR